MTILEAIASVFGIACVWLVVRRNHWSWPIGLIQVILTAIVLWDAKLYAETGLQIVFAFLQFYGWYEWLTAPVIGDEESLARNRVDLLGEGAKIKVERLTNKNLFVSVLMTVLMTVVFASLLILFTDAKAPIVDSLLASASLVAQYLLARRYLENWVYWILIDIVSIPLFASRSLYWFSGLYVIFLVLAIQGFLSWRRWADTADEQVEVAR
jgi:nicotinamide mononucleotide transporter